jgi:hypothetical protein
MRDIHLSCKYPLCRASHDHLVAVLVPLNSQYPARKRNTNSTLCLIGEYSGDGSCARTDAAREHSPRAAFPWADLSRATIWVNLTFVFCGNAEGCSMCGPRSCIILATLAWYNLLITVDWQLITDFLDSHSASWYYSCRMISTLAVRVLMC